MWFKINNRHVSLQIIAKPNAKVTALVAVTEAGLHIALHAKAADGEANKALIECLAKLLDIPKTSITLKRGDKSRHKLVVVPLTTTIQQLIDNPDKFLGDHCAIR